MLALERISGGYVKGHLSGGAGAATGNTFSGTELTGNAGAQADYETRRVYASLKTDLQKANAFNIRVCPHAGDLK